MYECVLVMECVSVCSCKCHAITCVFFPAAQPLTGLSLSTGLNECQQHSQQNLRTLGSLCCWMLLEKGFWEVILDFSFLLDKKTQSKWTNELLNQINTVYCMYGTYIVMFTDQQVNSIDDIIMISAYNADDVL